MGLCSELKTGEPFSLLMVVLALSFCVVPFARAETWETTYGFSPTENYGTYTTDNFTCQHANWKITYAFGVWNGGSHINITVYDVSSSRVVTNFRTGIDRYILSWSGEQFIGGIGTYFMTIQTENVVYYCNIEIQEDVDSQGTLTVGTPNQSPSSTVDTGQETKVSVNVTDAFNSVKNVTLLFTISNVSSWETPRTMSYNATSGYYEATIPGQQAGTTVKYQIIAFNNAGNHVTQNNTGQYYTYSVIPEFPTFLILPLFIIATLLAVIVYRARVRNCIRDVHSFC